MKYNKKYDAWYDDEKDAWLEERCQDKECAFCPDRPDKPSQADNNTNKNKAID